MRRFVGALSRSHDLHGRADRFRSAIPVELLCGGIPKNDPAFQIGTDDSHRRCIDDRGKRVFSVGFMQNVGR